MVHIRRANAPPWSSQAEQKLKFSIEEGDYRSARLNQRGVREERTFRHGCCCLGRPSPTCPGCESDTLWYKELHHLWESSKRFSPLSDYSADYSEEPVEAWFSITLAHLRPQEGIFKYIIQDLNLVHRSSNHTKVHWDAWRLVHTVVPSWSEWLAGGVKQSVATGWIMLMREGDDSSVIQRNSHLALPEGVSLAHRHSWLLMVTNQHMGIMASV